MTFIFVILAAAFTLVMLYQMVQPFLRGREDSLRFELLDEDLRKIGELAAQKAGVLKALREVQFDHDTGKLTDEDYAELKKRYELRALKIMRALDEIHGGRGWEQAIDAQLTERLTAMQREHDLAEKAALTDAILAAGSQATQSDGASAQIQRDKVQRDKVQRDKARQCPECSHQLDAEARFCSRCGTTLEAVDAAQALAHTGPNATT